MQQIKHLIANHKFEEALDTILLKVDIKTDFDDLITLTQLFASIPHSIFAKRGLVEKRIAILGGYTSDFLAQLLPLFLLKNGIFATVYQTNFGLFEQVIYSEDRELQAFKPDVCYVFTGTDQVGQNDFSAEIARWTKFWSKIHELLSCEIIQNVFEEPTLRTLGNLEFKNPSSRSSYVRKLNEELAARAPSFVHFNDVEFLSSYYGKKHWRDERLYDQAKIPVALNFLPHYVSNLSQLISGIFGKAKKCLVLDLDNTLWGGVIGDDGPAGILIGQGSSEGESFHRFQSFLKSLKERGIILAVCSKNEENLAKEPFQTLSEMVLKLEDISCFVANWNRKSDNIRLIAKTLNIGLDSMVFVDDNPAERTEVQREIPEILVFPLPDDPSEFASSLSEISLFDVPVLTTDDLKRTEQYKANTQRNELLSAAGDYTAYLKDLEMIADIASFDSQNIARISQLINKTNQFNLTTKRYSESEVTAMAASNDCLTRYVKLRDKFGDSGLISVFIGVAQPDSTTLNIDTWLMSCRVLKRSVEFFLFKGILEEIRTSPRFSKIKTIKGKYCPTAKNNLVKELLSSLGFTLVGENGDGSTDWQFSLQDPAAMERAFAIPTPISLSKSVNVI